MPLIIDLRDFRAANTASNPKTLGPGAGVDALNLDTARGDFRGLLAASSVHTLTGYGGQQQAIYRMGRETASDSLYWLAFANDVDFARSMLASDPTERTYGTGGSFDKPTFTDNTYLGAPPYPTGGLYIGIPAPASGMAAAVNTAGAGSIETRIYVTTYLRPSPNYDESAPSAAVQITCPGGSTVDLTSMPSGPGAGYGVTLRRIYVSTGGDFREVAETSVGVSSYTDIGVRGAILQTGGSSSKPAWLPPPDNMIGLIELWNGMHGGFTDKQYLTCVPYKPHGWPVEYRRQVPDRIVGSAKYGQNWVLATTGQARVVNGTTPMAMADSPTYLRAACVAKRSVRGVGHGVCWASAEGLAYYGQKGAALLTDGILTRTQWQALVPETVIGAAWGDWYIGFYDNGTKRAFMINTARPDGVIWLEQGAYAVFEDPLSSRLYLLDSGNTIKRWDSGAIGSARFKSKVYRVPGGTNPGAARVVATTYPVTFSLWADGALKVNGRAVSNDNPFTLPSGYYAEEFQVQIEGTGPVEGVFVADEMTDLP